MQQVEHKPLVGTFFGKCITMNAHSCCGRKFGSHAIVFHGDSIIAGRSLLSSVVDTLAVAGIRVVGSSRVELQGSYLRHQQQVA